MDVQIARSSYDEQYIVTGSSDSTAIIWDQKTGDSIQIISHPDSVINAFFLKGENELITETKDSIFSWVQKGRTWLINARTKGGVYSLGVNDYLYYNGEGVFLYSNKRHLFITGKSKYRVFMSPRKYIVTNEDSGYIKLYSKQNGKFIKQIKLAANNEYLQYPAFDEDESLMFYKTVNFVDPVDGDSRRERYDSLSFVNLSSEKLFKRRTIPSGNYVYNVGRDSLLITGKYSWDSSYIYSIPENRVIKRIKGQLAKISSAGNTILSVEGNKIILNRLSDSSTYLLQTTALESDVLANDSIVQNRFISHRSSAFTWKFRDNIFLMETDSVRLSDGDKFNVGYSKNGYFPNMGIQFYTEESKKYDISLDKKQCTLIQKSNREQIYTDTTGNVAVLRLHEASNTFVIVDIKNKISVFSLTTGKKLYNLSNGSKGFSGYGGVQSVNALTAGNLYNNAFELSGFSTPRTYYFYNKNGSHFYEIQGAFTNSGYQFSYMYVWSIDGTLVGRFTHAKGFGRYSVAFEKDSVVVLDAEYSKKLLTVTLGKDRLVKRTLCFENKLMVQQDNGVIDIWNISTGKLEKKITNRIVEGRMLYDSVTKQFIEVTPKKITLYNIALIPVRSIASNNLPLGENLQFIKNNELLLIGSRGYLTIFSLRSNKYFHLFFPDHNNWIVLDENGNFDGTEDARKTLYLTCGTEVVNLEQVKDQLWVPNLAERIIKGETINAKKLQELNICGFTPEVEKVRGNGEEYYFKIKPRRGGLGETVLLVNGIEARRYKSSELKKNGEFYDLIINKAELKNLFIAGKENRVTVKAYTSDNAISSRGVILLEDRTKEASIPPNLYAVMIGVSEYKGDELDLKYAAKDAGDISNAVSNAAKKLLNNDGKEHVFMYNLTTAQEHYLLPEKNSIKKVLEEIGKKATANDILLIFFAGHGVMETEKKQFYFLTADASKASAVSAIADVGISTAELTEWMKPQNIKAQKRILIFDACNSGQAIKDFVQLGSSDQNYMVARNEDKARQIKAIDKLNEHSGLFILSASASNQSAYEMGRYSQGLLTYSLLKAIKERPDILEAGKYLDV
ncbi:MAG: caspase family protein, partial [Ferruginibacter sp.]